MSGSLEVKSMSVLVSIGVSTAQGACVSRCRQLSKSLQVSSSQVRISFRNFTVGFVLLLNMLNLWKWCGCSWAGSSESLGIRYFGTEEQSSAAEEEFILPRYWIDRDDSEKVMTVRVHLPGCKKQFVTARTWNKRHLHVVAASGFNRYKLLYNLNYEARLLSEPSFAEDTGVLTCQFRGSTPKCVVCGNGLPRDSIIEAKEELSNRLAHMEEISILDADPLDESSSVELVEPRYWITYDGKMALFEADLQGVDYRCQIKFCVANHGVILQAFMGPRQYFLEVGLESSTKGGCKSRFDRRLGMFSASIPLLGRYECNGCIAAHHEASQVESKPDKEGSGKKVQFVRKESIAGNHDGQEEVMRSKKMGSAWGSSSFDSDFYIVQFIDEDVTVVSPVEITLYTETKV